MKASLAEHRLVDPVGLPDGRVRVSPLYRAPMASPHDFEFDTASILPDVPSGDDGQPLEVLHDREYRVQAYRMRDDQLLIRGAVRDQKPPGLYIAGDPDALTIHHMQLDLEVSFPMLEIVGASVEFVTHPNLECTHIASHYEKLVGLSIARGFTHRVRELFGGPRACTHTTALLQAMAPVAMQCMWSMQASLARRSVIPAMPGEMDQSSRDMLWRRNLNTCHVWAEDTDLVRRIKEGAAMGTPLFAEERMVKLGRNPDDWVRGSNT